jgi:uncharacterized protein
MKTRFVPILAVLLILAPIGCDDKPSTLLPVTTMQIGSERFTLEKAFTPHDQTVGLMHRDSLQPDHGMIFIDSKNQPQTFWNHDTHFNLDLIFLDSSTRVVDLKGLKAYDETAVSSAVPAQYVIELNAGTANRVHVKIGDQLTLPGDVLSASSQPSSEPTTP